MKLLSFALAMGVCAMPSWAVVIIADPTSAGGDYGGATDYFSTGTASSSNPGTGGNTGVAGNTAYRQTTYTYPTGAFGASNAVGEFSLLGSWNPATQGALNTVSFSIDSILVSGSNIPGTTTPVSLNNQLLFGVRQGGVNYYHAGFFPLASTWTNDTVNNLTQANFGSAFFTGAPQPNFSASGSVIEFGYFMSAVGIPGGGTAQWGVDNFCVMGNATTAGCAQALNQTPEPSTFIMIGGALAGLGILRRRKNSAEVQQ
jgi:hypothetical protein